MKRFKKNQMIKGMIFALAFGICIWCSGSVVSLAAGTANVTASSAKIRKSADTGSETVASVKKGDKLDVIASKKDSNGYTWYKVYVDDEETGYIRSDLVTVDGTISEEKSNDTKTENNSTAQTSSTGSTTTVVGSNSVTTEKKEEPAETSEVTVNETDVATAKATDDVRVRKGAGTKFDVAGQAKKGTEVTVTGAAADTEGKNWYQVSFSEGDKTVSGFIREDFLEVLSYAEPVEEEPVVEEVPQEPAVETQDYYVKYIQNDAGEMDWYLFNNIEGTSQSLTQILGVVEQVKNEGLKESEQVSTMRMILVALVIVVVVLIVAVTVLIFKLRDAYEYEDDDEEEEEDDDDDDEEDEEDSDDDEAEVERRSPRKSLRGFARRIGKTEAEEEDDSEEEEDTLEEVQPEKPAKTKKTENKAWQSKDFLELDDDMEFEFLDL